MSWIGKWRNQFGSVVEITDESGGRIEGTFRTALKDGGFYGQTVAVMGAHIGNCIGFTSASGRPTGDRVVSDTGLLRDGKWKPHGLSFPTQRSAHRAKARQPSQNGQLVARGNDQLRQLRTRRVRPSVAANAPARLWLQNRLTSGKPVYLDFAACRYCGVSPPRAYYLRWFMQDNQ